MNPGDWDKAMSAYRKQLPARTNVMMTATERPLPKRLTIRTGRADSTKVSVQIYDGNKKVNTTGGARWAGWMGDYVGTLVHVCSMIRSSAFRNPS